MMVCELYECEPRMFKEQFDKVSLILLLMMNALSYLGLCYGAMLTPLSNLGHCQRGRGCFGRWGLMKQ